MREEENYLSGLFDVGLSFSINGGYPRIALFSNRRDTVNFLQLVYGGRKYPHPHPNHKITWEWRIQRRNQALDFLDENRSILKLKAEQAEIIRECFEQRLNNGGPENYARRLSEARQQAYALPYLPNPATLAGILDTAGGMSFHLNPLMGHPLYDVEFSLTSPYTGMLTRLEEHYPKTHLTLARPSTKRYEGFPTHIWRAEGEDTREIFKDIQNHILFRRPLVDAMLFMLNTDGRYLSEEKMAQLQAIAETFRKR